MPRKHRHMPSTAFGKKLADPDLLLRLAGKPTGDEIRQRQLEEAREANRREIEAGRAQREARLAEKAEQRSLDRLREHYGIPQPEAAPAAQTKD